MNDPERLNQRGDVGASLLRAARRESPPASARKRATAAIGVAVALTASESAASVVAASAARALLVKAITSVGAVALLGGAVAVVVLPRVTGRSAPRAPERPPATRGIAERPALPAVGPLPVRAAPVASATQPLPAVASDRTVAPPARPSVDVTPPPRVQPSVLPARASLGDEVAALGRAQQALESGHAGDALRLVDAFLAEVPDAHLRPEAEALRIEALAATGDRAGARSFLRVFRDTHPESPLIEHLGAVTGP
jgi:hypothetical protein